MRLTTKFVLVCTLVSSIIEIIITATPLDRIIMTSTADQVIFGTNTVTLAKDEGKKLLSALLASSPVKVTSAVATGIAVGDYTVTLDNGDVTTVTVADASGNQSFDLSFKKGTSPSVTTIDVTFADFNSATAGTIGIAETKLQNGQISSIAGFAPAGESVVITSCIDRGGLYTATMPAAATFITKAATALPTTYHFCYAPSDKDFMLCVKKDAASTTVTVRPKVAGGSAILEKIGGPLLVVILGMILSVIISYIFATIDPEGYQAGKEASSLPDFVKFCLADAEGYGGEGYYGDDEGSQEIYKVDPSTGRTIRLKKDGSPIPNDDREGSAGEETTDASTFTLVAALFAIPFLL